MSSSLSEGRITRKAEGLGASIHGGRPTFAIRKLADQFTLYELLPEDQAIAHKRRWKNNRRLQKQVKLVDTGFIDGSDWSWNNWTAVKITQLDQRRLDSVKSLLKGVFEDTESQYTELLKTGERTVLLPEAVGVKLALAFIGVKSLQRVDKQRSYVRQLEHMSYEECYYWHALARSPSTPNGAKALRTLLTDHIR